VRDSGIWISKQNQTKAVSKFSQVHSDKTKYGGTGLGLLLCKQFVELMDGQIGIDSRGRPRFHFLVQRSKSARMRQQKARDHKLPITNLVGHVLVSRINRSTARS